MQCHILKYFSNKIQYQKFFKYQKCNMSHLKIYDEIQTRNDTNIMSQR